MAPIIRINGKVYRIEHDFDMPLLWYLRDHLGLMGTKYCCGNGECGACTVLADGEAVLSCVTSVQDLLGMDVITIEGLNDTLGQALIDAWITEDVPQCGYCQPGQIMTAVELLQRCPQPSDAQIDETMSAVLCRCGTYPAIRRAIKRAAKKLAR